MYTRTLIGNLALGHLGDRHITDIDDLNSNDAEVIRDFYDHAVGFTYTAQDWQWARKEAELARLPTTPVTVYEFFYQLPSNFARPSKLAEDAEMRVQIDEQGGWQIIAGKLATNAESVFMHYVANDWSEAVWPPHFADAVSLKLAALSAPRITHNMTQREALNDRFNKVVLPGSRVTDSQYQQNRPRIIRSQWARDRFSRGVRQARPDIE